MSDRPQDFDLTALLGANQPTFDYEWSVPSGEDLGFSAWPDDGTNLIDPSLLQMLVTGQESNAWDFSALPPAESGFDFDQL